MKYFDDREFKLSEEQIDKILENLVPLIAEHEDHVSFYFTLRRIAEESYSPTFAALVAKLLRSAEQGGNINLSELE